MLLELLYVNWVLVFSLRLEFNSSFGDEVLSEAVWADRIYGGMPDVDSIFFVFESESIELEEV